MESEKNLAVERELRENGRAEQERLTAATINLAIERLTNASNAQLKVNGTEFAALSRKNIDDVLTPFKEQLKFYGEQVRKVRDDGARQESAMKEHVAAIELAARKMGADAGEFINNLRFNNKAQGDFGENRLACVLSGCGLAEGQDYLLQRGEGDGIPDCQVFDHIGRKICIIDAKSSWKDYEAGMRSDRAEEREAAMKRHVESIRKQINNLSGKRYHEKIANSREGYTPYQFSIMFVPSDGALMAALETDSTLTAYAADRKVYLTSPLNLYNLLRLIQDQSSNYEISRNVAELVKAGELVVERVDLLFSKLEEIGRDLDKAREKHLAVMKLAADDGNCIRGPAKKMTALGIRIEKARSRTLASEEEA